MVEANARAEFNRQQLDLASPIDLSEDWFVTPKGEVHLAPAKEDISVAEMLGRIHLPDNVEDDAQPPDDVTDPFADVDTNSLHPQGSRSTHL